MLSRSMPDWLTNGEEQRVAGARAWPARPEEVMPATCPETAARTPPSRSGRW